MAKKRSTNVTKLAKSSTTKTTAKKEESTKTVDEKAKERVEKLLNEVDVNPKKDELLELDETPTDPNDVEWLQEQVKNLSERNEHLEKENVQYKDDYKKIFNQLQSVQSGKGGDELVPESMVVNNVKEMFHELQNNFLGNNPQRQRYTNATIVVLLNKMIKLFPFLQGDRRF